jgi:DNA helicase-2/ATP-dependent DNA helicase PcrA
MDLSSRYRKLNPAQKQAVDTIEGPVMVVAGPGTGKTELLGVRVANILSKTDTLPENILCLTFTDSGATAMRERLISIIGKDAYKVAIHTFHSFGTEIINQNREYFYNGASFQAADDLTRYEILRGIFTDLDYKNPLASTMNGEFTHQNDAARVIAELKRSGLTSEELRVVLDMNEAALDITERLVVPIMDDKINKNMGPKLAALLPALREQAEAAKTVYEITPLLSAIYDSLVVVVNETEAEHPTKPLTAWKKKWMEKDKAGKLCFKSRRHLEKLRAVVFIYYEYLRRMEAEGLFDYDDMILQVVHALEVHNDLRFNLQEKYLYIMVDEFQDTNVAQMRIINSLTNNPVNEGRPNIMVVGDDDQAIYSFQGADISNVLRFREVYPQTELVVLTDNYRSKKAILEHARQVITQGADRLENLIPALNKTLSANNPGEGVVQLVRTETAAQERQWVVNEIKKRAESGVSLNDIAVLTRKHGEIAELLPYFTKAGIKVRYERQDNALDEAPIKALELLAKVVVGLADGLHDVVNGLLPELLAHPAWEITPAELWRLSSDAYDARKRWMDVMETTPRFVPIHAWLVELAQASLTSALEPLLDTMIGRPSELDETPPYSPLYNCYFSDEALAKNPTQYLDYLTSLQTIRSHIREYNTKEEPTLESFVEFIRLHRQLGTRLPITRLVGEGEGQAVNLMTAHKSKGLEYDTVFVLHAIDSIWGEKARTPSRSINYPENLPLAPAGNNSDERLRLFYVAMTRAKAQLYMSFSSIADAGKTSLVASFLSDQLVTDQDSAAAAIDAVTTAELAWYEPLTQPTEDLVTILKPKLSTYKLSATHLNHFLDVSRGGPQSFLLDNLLHFPSTKPAAASYGTAIHSTIQQVHLHMTATGQQKPLEDVLHDFETFLARERLSPAELQQYTQKGSEQLTTFLAQRADTFTQNQKPELNFSYQDVHVGDAHLTGMLDVVDIYKTEKTMHVTDYKTGKPIKDGVTKTEFEKIKLHKYKQQLLFYKLLVENSRDYRNFTVTSGCLSFVEPTTTGEIVDTTIQYEPEELERLKLLIDKVWQKIISLDLPDIGEYEQSYKGILKFEQDLIDGLI